MGDRNVPMPSEGEWLPVDFARSEAAACAASGEAIRIDGTWYEGVDYIVVPMAPGWALVRIQDASGRFLGWL